MGDEFKVHLLNEKGIARASLLANAFDELLDVLALPSSRERSLVVTKLQEASFWAKRAIAVDPENQK